jgi:hypothetical protein
MHALSFAKTIAGHLSELRLSEVRHIQTDAGV